MSNWKYDLHQLGWHSFQQLCIAVTTKVLGQTVESFLDGNDGGRDGAFSGSWSPQENEFYQGKFVIQCKFSSRREHNLNYSDIADELSKAKRLVEKGQCDVYVLMSHVAELVDHLDCILSTYPDWPGIDQTIQSQKEHINDWLSEVFHERDTEAATGRDDLMFASSHQSGRSIFDDVDI